MHDSLYLPLFAFLLLFFCCGVGWLSWVPLSWHVSPCGICDMSFVSLLPATATFS